MRNKIQVQVIIITIAEVTHVPKKGITMVNITALTSSWDFTHKRLGKFVKMLPVKICYAIGYFTLVFQKPCSLARYLSR